MEVLNLEFVALREWGSLHNEQEVDEKGLVTAPMSPFISHVRPGIARKLAHIS